MMDDLASETLKQMLRRAGLTRVGLAGPMARKDLASAPGCGEEDRKRRHSPTAGEGIQPMRIREKDRGGETPAKVPMLRLVSTRCEPTRTRAGMSLSGVGSHLVLVWSDGHRVTKPRWTARR